MENSKDNNIKKDDVQESVQDNKATKASADSLSISAQAEQIKSLDSKIKELKSKPPAASDNQSSDNQSFADALAEHINLIKDLQSQIVSLKEKEIKSLEEAFLNKSKDSAALHAAAAVARNSFNQAQYINSKQEPDVKPMFVKTPREFARAFIDYQIQQGVIK